MMDTMTFTKLLGGLCGTFLVYLLGKFAAEQIYHVGGHGDHYEQAYVIDTGEDDAAGEAVPEVDFMEVFAAADASKGEGVFRKCSACHKLEDGANGTGPTLYGVVGREADSVAGFGYSGALEQVVDVWSPEHLNGFLERSGVTKACNRIGLAPDNAVKGRTGSVRAVFQ
ncbi:MAG: cytochrome c family protein, partial [Pseudomonadota bacterium]